MLSKYSKINIYAAFLSNLVETTRHWNVTLSFRKESARLCGSLALCAKSDRRVSNLCQNKYILAISSDKGVISLSWQEMWKFYNSLTGHFEYSLKVILREFWGPTGI